MLLDPGSVLTFGHTLRKIKEIIPFSQIRHFICHHQDPDITGALPLIDQMVSRDDAVLITHWRTQMLIKHCGLRMPFWLVEFAIFVVGDAVVQIIAFAERLRTQVAVIRFEAPMTGRVITVSIGIAIRQPQETLLDLMQRADTALYEAKNGGRNRVCMTAETVVQLQPA